MKIAVIYRELFLLLLTTTTYCRNIHTKNTNDKYYWYNKNLRLLESRMQNLQVERLPRVKNVVIFIGDGMDLTTITASRVLKRQITHNPDAMLTFDEFPATALMQTDIVDSQIPESAACSTALFCGVKTNFENLGVDVTATESNVCENTESYTQSIITWAQKKNLKTGFVTTTRITHATPAALYAHSRRHVEDDSKLDTASCSDIARQLIENETGRKLNVIMGGGMRSFIPHSSDGRRKDGRNLTSEWIEKHPNGKFVTNRDEMINIDENVEHVLGIFANTHMNFNADRNESVEPSLTEMTKSAIDVLSRNNTRGFLLVVEAGKIDLAHHRNNAYRALDDTLALDRAIEMVANSLDLSQSLIIVTSDHSSSISYAGFATPKTFSILGMDKYKSNTDNERYQLLTYSSGQGHFKYNETLALHDPKNSYHKATIGTTWSNHGAEDVPFYAIGSLSRELFSGTFDQTYLAHAVAYAMCIFQYESRCSSNVKVQGEKKTEEPVPKVTLKGIEALRREMAKETNGKIYNKIQHDEIKFTSSTENLIQESTTDENMFESSDLVSDFTENNNSSCSTMHSKYSLTAFSIIFTINFRLF